MAAHTPMCFQFGLQFENLFKLVCQGGTTDCLLYRTHVGRFDTTCAGSRAEQQTSDCVVFAVSSNNHRCKGRLREWEGRENAKSRSAADLTKQGRKSEWSNTYLAQEVYRSYLKKEKEPLSERQLKNIEKMLWAKVFFEYGNGLRQLWLSVIGE